MYYISSFLLIPRENDLAHSLLLIPNGFSSLNQLCFSSFSYTALSSLLDLMSSTEWNKCDVVGRVITGKKVFWDCGGFRDIRWFVNWSAVFVETVFESSFGFSYIYPASRGPVGRSKGLCSQGKLYIVWSLNIFTVYVIVKLFVTILGSFNEGRQFIIVNKGFVCSHRCRNYCKLIWWSLRRFGIRILKSLKSSIKPPGGLFISKYITGAPNENIVQNH